MPSFDDALLAGGLLAAAIVVGALTGWMGWCLFVASIIWIVIQARQYRRVLQWSKRPLGRPQNGLEPWFVLAYNPYRALQRQRNRTRAIGRRMRQLLLLAEVIPDGVVILAPSGEIEGLNQAAKNLLQLKDSDIGLGLATIIRVPEFIAFVRAPEPPESPLEFVSPFDADKTYEARRVSMENQRSVIIIRDITTLNRLLTMRQNFVANVSHELRTPITVVNGYLETIADDEQPEDLRLALTQKLQPPMKRMRSLVDDLLLLSQLESTAEAEQKSVLPVSRMLSSAVSEVQGLAKRKDQVSMSCDPSMHVHGNEKELHSVCVNLLTNALRYTSDDAPVVLSCARMDDQVRVSVQDNGIGIAPEHLQHITERFYRVDMAGARSSGGTGLGLAIVKHILLRHDSSLMVESELGKGSLFYFDLELCPAPAAAPSETSQATS